jgi:prepilin-type N-terminal cleavage/methylation domain-containing protein
MKRHAFTLVELLVVIAIIGLLSTVAVVALSGARAGSRNAKRNADIAQLSKAFYMAYDAAGAGSYPASGGACVSAACGGSWSGISASATIDAYLSPYLSAKPIDPADGKRSVTGFVYTTTFSGASTYDSYVFPTGAYVSWFMETVPSLSGICGAGHIYSSSATQTQCFLQLTQ